MGSKHKDAQAQRRNARKIMAGYGKQWGDKLKVFNEALKPRPKYIPLKLWRWLSSLFVDMQKIEDALNGK